ncbi:MAG TPA: dTMP kinase [Microthrixaceae bacterium]|nr:dTMP kinase [Microthrixaceae bacterium]
MSGRFIVLEGGEGSGKSTQARLLADDLDALLTRQPGGTPAGSAIRELLLDPSTTLEPRAEALLMAADRAEHVASVIRPALDAGVDVVCDRYAYSSVAYQGYGRGLPPDEVARLSGWATQDLWPDLVVLLVVDDGVAAARLDRELDRFEQAGPDFHRRVADGFAALAEEDPARFVVVDGTGSVEEVAARIRSVVEARLPS